MKPADKVSACAGSVSVASKRMTGQSAVIAEPWPAAIPAARPEAGGLRRA
jgi:hypothetical protein